MSRKTTQEFDFLNLCTNINELGSCIYLHVKDFVEIFNYLLHYCVNHYTSSPLEDTVVQVKATDADDPNTDNGQVRYTLPSGRTSGLFEINYETGRHPAAL